MANKRKKKIVLTGGGTAGHVTPNIALLPALRDAGYEIAYVGSEDGIEKELMRDCGYELWAKSIRKPIVKILKKYGIRGR